MTWIRVETNVAENDKVLAFAEGCGISAETALGFLVRFWGRVAEHRPDGDLSEMSDSALERWAAWNGMPSVFAVELRKHFLPNGLLTGWLERQGKLAARAAAERERKRRGNSAEEVPLRNDTGRNIPTAPPPTPPPRPVGRSAALTYTQIQERLATALGEVSDGTRERFSAAEMRELQAELVFAYWQAKMGHKGARLDTKRLNRLTARLKENDGDVHELLYVVDGALLDSNLMGQNERNRKYDGIETLFRDRGQVERLAALKKYEAGKRHPMATKYLESSG